MTKNIQSLDEETDEGDGSSETTEEVNLEPVLPKMEPRSACLMNSL